MPEILQTFFSGHGEYFKNFQQVSSVSSLFKSPQSQIFQSLFVRSRFIIHKCLLFNSNSASTCNIFISRYPNTQLRLILNIWEYILPKYLNCTRWAKNRDHCTLPNILKNCQRYLHDLLHTSWLVYTECLFTQGLVTLFHTVAPSGESDY